MTYAESKGHYCAIDFRKIGEDDKQVIFEELTDQNFFRIKEIKELDHKYILGIKAG